MIHSGSATLIPAWLCRIVLVGRRRIEARARTPVIIRELGCQPRLVDLLAVGLGTSSTRGPPMIGNMSGDRSAPRAEVVITWPRLICPCALNSVAPLRSRRSNSAGRGSRSAPRREASGSARNLRWCSDSKSLSSISRSSGLAAGARTSGTAFRNRGVGSRRRSRQESSRSTTRFCTLPRRSSRSASSPNGCWRTRSRKAVQALARAPPA